MSDQEEKKTSTIKLSAEALKHLTLNILENSENSSSTCVRRGKEIHPRAVHSTTKQVDVDGLASSKGSSDSTPVNSSPRSLTAKLVPRCGCSARNVKRQLSTSVDCGDSTPGALAQAEKDEYVIIDSPPGGETSQMRPRSLGIQRNLSKSSGSGRNPLPERPEMRSPRLPTPEERNFVSSYPPGPTVTRAECLQGTCRTGETPSRHRPCLSLPEGASGGNSQQILARKIADRLKAIGDHLTSETEQFQLTELVEDWLAYFSITSNSGPSWRNIVQLYQALSRLLAECLEEGGAVSEDNERWLTFSKLWKIVLHTIVGWIADNGGWYAFIRETEYTANAYITSSTPDCTRRRFTYPHATLDVDPSHYSTPQTHRRRGFGPIQSSPSLACGRGSERGSRVLSLTEEGLFHLEEEDVCDENAVNGGPSSEDEDQRSHDEGLQMSTPSSQSSLSPEGHGSPVIRHTSLESRPQSSTLPSEGIPMSEGSGFDRNHSRSYPRQRPSSAGNEGQYRSIFSVVEDICEGQSLDSGLEASSEASIASTDSTLQYNALGVSAVCILEALKSMLDHK